MAKFPIGLQLYTLRDDCATNFTGTVEQVAKIGYKGVEIAGDTGGMNAKELKKFLDDLGLVVTGSHVGIEAIMNDLQSQIDTALELENKWIVCSYISEEWRSSTEDYIKVAKIFEKAGAKCKEAGLQVCYHNHSFEFTKFDGKYGLDVLYENSDSDLLKAELDTYWVKHGGEDPIAYIKKYSGRIPLIHLKDMADDENRSYAEVGTGILDMEAIFSAAEEAGTEWLIVEQDFCPGPPLESVKISFENLKKFGVA